MADEAVTGANVIKLAMNEPSADILGQSVASGDTAVLTPQPGQVLFTNGDSEGAQFDSGHMVVVLENGGGGASTVTFKAGVLGGTPANRAVYGDLEVSLAASDRKYVQLELSRFQTADRTVEADVSGQSVLFTVVQLDEAA